MTGKRHFAILLLLLMSLFAASVLLAQEEPQPVALTLTSVNPLRVTAGQTASLNLTGSGFTEDTRAQIGDANEIDPDFVSESSLTMALPSSLSAGSYDISVSNPDGSSANLPNALTVEDPPVPTVPPIIITQVEPKRLVTGQEVTLSILGSNFTSASIVRVVGAGLLQTTFVNSSALTAVLPGTLAAGRYSVEVSDPNGSSASLTDALRVVNPPPPTEQPTQAPPTATPIVIVNKPLLALTNFVAQPAVIEPGQTVNLTFTVTNVGTQAARTIVISLGTGSSFVPAGGQSSLTLPDLGPGAAYNSQMSVSVALDVADGPIRIPLALTYQDQAGEAYTANAELSVTVRSVVSSSQIIIDAYTTDPSPAEPGQPVMVRMTVANMGNKTASQVSVRFNGSENLLLPSGSGDTFVIGDLQPGQRAPLQAPLILNTEAKNGPQVQPITIAYVQDGEAKESSTTMTVNVLQVNQPQPLLLLSKYSTSEEVLQPGSRFTLDVTLQNAGAADARTVILTFGTVESSGDSGDSDTNGGGGSGSQSSTTPSTTFAPLGTAGLAYIGDIAAGATVEVNQEFLITGGVSTGIYNLPVTLQHTQPDGTLKQNLLNISLVVIVPPRLRVSLSEPLPEIVNVGEPFPLMLELVNDGRSDLNLTVGSVTADNAEVIEGGETRLERLKADDDTNLSALIMPVEEGAVEITITLNYLNDLNQPGSIEQTYAVEAMMPPPIEEPIDPVPVVVEPEPEVDWFGQTLMALLGLGS